MKPFSVVVGNVGHVWEGSNFAQACSQYSAWVKRSKANDGRCAGEPVTLFHHGKIRMEYFGKLETQED